MQLYIFLTAECMKPLVRLQTLPNLLMSCEILVLIRAKVLSVRYFKCEMINMAQISSFLLDITSLVSPSQSHPVADGFDAIGASQDDDL